MYMKEARRLMRQVHPTDMIRSARLTHIQHIASHKFLRQRTLPLSVPAMYRTRMPSHPSFPAHSLMHRVVLLFVVHRWSPGRIRLRPAQSHLNPPPTPSQRRRQATALRGTPDARPMRHRRRTTHPYRMTLRRCFEFASSFDKMLTLLPQPREDATFVLPHTIHPTAVTRV